MVGDAFTPGLLGFEKFPGKFEMRTNSDYFGKTKEKVLVYTGNFSQLYQFYKKAPRTGEGSHNRKQFNEKLYAGESSSKGGSFETLFQPSDKVGQVREYEQKLSKNKVMEKLVEQTEEISRRRRVRSAYDGEYDHDKRWECEPFTKREMPRVPTNTMSIKVSAGFSWMIPASTIDDFGCFVASIINLFEKTGVLVKLSAFYAGTGLATGMNSHDLFEIKVKEPDEYLPVQSILKVFSSNWFRRGIFSLMVAGAEFGKCDVNTSLGSVYSFDKTWEVKDNTLFIYSVPTVEDQTKIIEKLSESFCITKEKES